MQCSCVLYTQIFSNDSTRKNKWIMRNQTDQTSTINNTYNFLTESKTRPATTKHHQCLATLTPKAGTTCGTLSRKLSVTGWSYRDQVHMIQQGPHCTTPRRLLELTCSGHYRPIRAILYQQAVLAQQCTFFGKGLSITQPFSFPGRRLLHCLHALLSTARIYACSCLYCLALCMPLALLSFTCLHAACHRILFIVVTAAMSCAVGWSGCEKKRR